MKSSANWSSFLALIFFSGRWFNVNLTALKIFDFIWCFSGAGANLNCFSAWSNVYCILPGSWMFVLFPVSTLHNSGSRWRIRPPLGFSMILAGWLHQKNSTARYLARSCIHCCVKILTTVVFRLKRKYRLHQVLGWQIGWQWIYFLCTQLHPVGLLVKKTGR